MKDHLILAVPSKGRLMDQTLEYFESIGLALRKVGSERGYRGEIVGLPGVEVIFVSASEIAEQLKLGRAHLGVTGADLVHELMPDWERHVKAVRRLGFGQADVVVAVPACWLDARTLADIEPIGQAYRANHGRHLRVATKYKSLTRKHFAQAAITSYRIVESLGATEGTPAAGNAELIVDIMTTGTTLRANGLKVLEDGILLRSEATLYALTSSREGAWTPASREALNQIRARISAA